MEFLTKLKIGDLFNLHNFYFDLKFTHKAYDKNVNRSKIFINSQKENFQILKLERKFKVNNWDIINCSKFVCSKTGISS
jgi:hypothetical protein